MRLTLTLATILSLVFTHASAQDLDKGLEAYKLGNYATALKEWKPLADQGDAAAQANLGFMYIKGYGVRQDYSEALKWFQRAAEQGDARAQYFLGFMYGLGYGVLQDNVTAHMWYNIASANGRKKAGKWRGILADLMTASAIEKATAMAEKCMKSDYQECGR